ncbi:PREDICTED: integrator complex subunit 10 [Papilio polytes]|uniref:integrator complex subunit 10 n=1 Tax=Papilio polytes TaxID=76194 RepID=UPI000676047C|nr:PREDICTED: integrator complex subunit 10 [Papilio polytes]
MPIMVGDFVTDGDYIIARAKLAQSENNIYAAKAWMLTAKTLFPTNFKIQFEAYLMEKQSGNVQEAAECFSSLMMSRQNVSKLLPEILSIANALKSNEPCFLSQMFDNICPDMQLTILKTSVENSDDTMEHCRLLVLLLKKFPQLGVDSLVKTLINADKFFYDNRYARLLVVETLPLLSSLESPRLLQRLMVKAIDFYNSYMYDETENDITDPWQRLYGVLDLLGRQLGWDTYLVNYTNSLNKETYFQKLMSLRGNEDCRELLYCGVTFFLRSLYEQKSLKGNHILIEALSDPDQPPSKRRKGDIEVTGISAHQFQAAANVYELLNSNELIAREFMKLVSQLQVKPWTEGFTDEIALYRGRYEDATPPATANSLSANITRVSINFAQKKYLPCIDAIFAALSQLPAVEGVLETDLIVGGKHRHLHFLPLTKVSIMHYFCTLLIRILLSTGSNADLTYGHILVLMQLGWPQEEAIFIQILDIIKQKGVFHYHLFSTYVIHIDFLEELSFIWNEQGKNIALDILPNSQHLGQRRIGTRGADKGVKEDFKQAMKAQVARCNESILNLIIQFISTEKPYLFQVL